MLFVLKFFVPLQIIYFFIMRVGVYSLTLKKATYLGYQPLTKQR